MSENQTVSVNKSLADKITDYAETLKASLEGREEPIVLKPFETCIYSKVCPYSKPDCFGTRSDRNWDFVCDIKELKRNNYKPGI